MIKQLRFDFSLLLKRNFQWACMIMMLLSFSSYAQNNVTGTVIGEDGAGLPGATVLAEGTSVGTVTDINGQYSLTMPAGSNSVVISFIGYATQVIPVNGRSVIDASMTLDAETLGEVVVVGYGTQKKSDLTGAIASVDAQTITERGTTNAIQALQGTVAGVNIGSPNGRLGDGAQIQIRGNNSFAQGSGPLYVVDGVITENIDFLNPQDIASMDILKDASSAAIYGSRGSNGVIIVSTKGGSSVPDGTTVSFETFYGFKNAARLPEMMSPEQWQYYHMSAYLATVNTSTVTTPDEYYQAVLSDAANPVLQQRFAANDGFDWYDAVLKSGMQSNNHLSIAHRSGKSTYTLGVGYQEETGLIENEGLSKFTIRSSMDQQLSDKFKTGVRISASLTENQRGSELAMQEAFRLNPFLSPWAIDANGNEIEGELFPQPGKLLYPDGSRAIDKTSTYNPLLEIANSSDESRQWNLLGSTYLQYDVLDWLSLKTSLSAGMQTYQRGKYWGAQTNRGIGNDNLASSELSNYTNFNYSWDNQINFTKEFDKHRFNALALQSVYVNRTDSSGLASSRQPFETEFYNVGSGQQAYYNLGNQFQQSQLLSYALRLNYVYDNKYHLTVSNRWDGSSLLAEGHQWNSFPSVAAAWTISNESFLQGNNTVSNLKLRVGFGTTGNNNVDPYSTVSALNTQTYYDYNGSTANGWLSSSLANKSLTWEKTKEVNIAMDFGFFGHRISGSIDWYNRLSDKLLVNQQLALESGYEEIRANAGSVRNKGVELMLTTVNVETEMISWETTFTFTKNKNTIESIYGQSENDDVGNGLFIGESVNAHYNYVFDGIWQANQADEAASYGQEEGQARVQDLNTDGVIDPDDDRTILGSWDPSWVGGIISRLKVSNFDFNIVLSTKQGVLANSNFHRNFEDVRDRGRQKLAIADWYVPENPYGVAAQTSNSYPQPRNAGTYWRNDGVGYYKDASYIKINNISLGYSLPSSVLEKMKVQQFRVYVNVLNPFTFTDFTGYDPEWAQSSLAIGRVSSVTTQLGLSVKF